MGIWNTENVKVPTFPLLGILKVWHVFVKLNIAQKFEDLLPKSHLHWNSNWAQANENLQCEHALSALYTTFYVLPDGSQICI